MTITVRRVAVATAVWGGVLALMILAGMGPNPVLLALTVGALAVGCWLFADLGESVESANWYMPVETSMSNRGDDSRVDLLCRDIDGFTHGAGDILSPELVSLIDARVSSHHGVDRAEDPVAFSRIVGPELDAFIAAAESSPRPMRPAALSGIITRIEAL